MLLALLAGLYLVATGTAADRDGRLLWAGIASWRSPCSSRSSRWPARPWPGPMSSGSAGAGWCERVGGALLVGAPSLLALAGWAGWSWKLSPVTFAATMNRWLNSAVSAPLPPSLADGPEPGQLDLAARIAAPRPGVGPRAGPGVGAVGAQAGAGLHGRVRLLWTYSLVAIGLSFATSLKEPRHLIGVLPAAALVTADVLVCLGMAARGPGSRPGAQPQAGRTWAGRVAVEPLWRSSSRCRPRRCCRGLGVVPSWLAPVYAERLAAERYYNILARAGKRWPPSRRRAKR